MKILVDMNLSPEWLPVLGRSGWEASHWSTVGAPTAADTELFDWARENGWLLLTQDLDFAELLFHTQAGAPSIVLLRLRDELDAAQQARVCALLKAAADALESGGLLVIEPHRARLRRLPIHPDGEA